MEAKLNARNLEISTKVSVEICNLLRYKNIEKAKNALERVTKKKQPVPYKRYNKEIPHRKGKIMSGRYPIKASKVILKLLNSIIANAQQKGMSSNLYISHISAHKASSQFHYSRHRGRVMKRTHLKIIVKESKQAKKETKKPEVRKELPKKETKPVENKK